MTADDQRHNPDPEQPAPHGQEGPVGGKPTGPAGRSGQGYSGSWASAEPGGDDEYDVAVPDTPESLVGKENDGPAEPAGTVHPDTRRAAEHLEDLRRLQAEYVNYKKRVDRDRDVAQARGVSQVIEALLPVLDDIHAAREHGELTGPMASVADKLTATLGRFGVESLGATGEEFDPAVHEALMHVDADLPDGATGTTVVQVIQPGFRIGDRVVRPARVAVADPR